MCLPLLSWSAWPLSSSSLHEAQKESDGRRVVQSPQHAADTEHAAACRSGEALRRPPWISNRWTAWAGPPTLCSSLLSGSSHDPRCCCSPDTGVSGRHSL